MAETEQFDASLDHGARSAAERISGLSDAALGLEPGEMGEVPDKQGQNRDGKGRYAKGERDGEGLEPQSEVDENPDDDEQEADQNVEKDAAKDGETDEDYIEVPGEDGKEPTRVKLSEALEGYNQWRALEQNKGQILERVETEANQRFAQGFQALQSVYGHAAREAQAFIAMLPQPKAPDAALLDPNHANYNPEQWMRENAQSQFQLQQRGAAMQQLQRFEQQQQMAASAAQQQQVDAEWSKLIRRAPDWGTKGDVKRSEAITLLSEKYGFDEATLETIVDHRFFLAVDDLMKYHGMVKAAGDKKETPQKKGNPKLVRNQTQRRQTGPGKQGQDYAAMRADLRKSGTQEAAAKLFGRFAD